MVKRSIFAILSIFAASNIWACYDPAGSGQCGPNGIGPRNPSGYNNSVGNNGGYYDPSRIPPPPITVILPDRFGAVARAINNHGFSSVYNMNSKQEARRKVLQLCTIENASPCKIYLEYANGCISMASGKGPFNRYYPVYSISQQQGQTQRDVMEKCSAQYSDCGIAIEEECSIARPPR